MVATYDDANLIVQLARWGTEMGLDRVQPAATKDRERIGEARLYDNFEALADSAGT